jgi:peptidyl-prolyl cis-trans isomerase D
MALIGKIREKSGFVLVLIALAVIGFLWMDAQQGGPTGSSSIFDNPNVKGAVNGTKINTNEFDRVQKTLYANAKDAYGANAQVWNYFVEKAIVDGEAKCLGLGVCKEELEELQYSADPSRLSPIIQQRFASQTGQVDMATLQNVKSMLDDGSFSTKNPQGYAYWLEQEKEIAKDRLQTKFNTLISKGAYAPSWMAEMLYAEQNTKIDAIAVKVPYNAVADSEVQVADADYKAYIEDNKNTFFRDRPARKISYAAFNVVATRADSQAVAATVAKLIPDFKAAKNDSVFTMKNGGANDGSYAKKEQMSKMAADSLFAKPVGAVVGPYLDAGAYRIAKILGRRSVPDSVKARHVLFQDMPKKLTDSLFESLKSGKISWDTLNRRYSADKVSAMKGGDLGYFGSGAMVKEFNDLCFYKAEPGKYYTVNTQFGTHILQVTGVKAGKNEPAVRIAYIEEQIKPSDATQNAVKDKAVAVLQQSKNLEALKTALEKENIQLTPSQPFEESDYAIGGLGTNGTTRDIIRWANKADEGDVSTEVYSFNNENEYHANKYVVVGLQAALPAGLPDVASVKEEIKTMVIDRKKGEVIKAKLAGKDLNGALTVFNLPGMKIDTMRQVVFASQYGTQPKLVGALYSIAQGATTAPVATSSGVYVAQVINRQEATAPADLAATKKQLNMVYRNQLRSRLIPTMKDKAAIKDYRTKQGL